MRLDESDARRRFARLKNAVEGSGPITLRLTGPPDLYGPYGDVESCVEINQCVGCTGFTNAP